MATPRMDVSSFVGKLLEEDDVDVLRDGVRVLAQALMETEVSGQIGAAPYECFSSCTAYRNGYRTRTWDTRVGTIELKIPKVSGDSMAHVDDPLGGDAEGASPSDRVAEGNGG
jgi:transposase-like protein